VDLAEKRRNSGIVAEVKVDESAESDKDGHRDDHLTSNPTWATRNAP